MIKGFFYRLIMRIAHKYNWHYAPPIYPDGDTQLWCKWCGFQQTIKRVDEHCDNCENWFVYSVADCKVSREQWQSNPKNNHCSNWKSDLKSKEEE